MKHFKLKLDHTSIEHHRPSINVRSIYLRQTAWQKKQYLKAQTVNHFERKRETHQYVSQYWKFFILLLTACIFTWNEEKHTTLMLGLSIRSFWNGIGEGHADPEWPEWFKNTTDVYSIHFELRMALPSQISTGKWKYVNPCLDFLGIPDQRTAYVKRQVRPGWTSVPRSSVTPDRLTGCMSGNMTEWGHKVMWADITVYLLRWWGTVDYSSGWH